MRSTFVVTISLLSLIALPVWARSKSEKVLRHAHVVKTVTIVAKRVGVPVELMLAIAWTESSYRPNLLPRVDGSSPSYGLFQIKLETAEWVDSVYKHKNPITSARLQDIYVNTFYACKYMKLLLKRYDGNVKMAVDAYNKGHAVSTESVYVTKVHLAMQGVK